MAQILSKLDTLEFLGFSGSLDSYCGRKIFSQEIIDVFHRSDKEKIFLDLSENFTSMGHPDRDFLDNYVTILNGNKIAYNAGTLQLLHTEGAVFPHTHHEVKLISLIGEYAHEGCEITIHTSNND
jgi:hypothetical protein